MDRLQKRLGIEWIPDAAAGGVGNKWKRKKMTWYVVSKFMSVHGWHFHPRNSQSAPRLVNTPRSRLCLYMLNANRSAVQRLDDSRFSTLAGIQLIHLSACLTHTRLHLYPHIISTWEPLPLPHGCSLPTVRPAAVTPISRVSCARTLQVLPAVQSRLSERLRRSLPVSACWCWVHAAVVSPDNTVIVLDGVRQSCC